MEARTLNFMQEATGGVIYSGKAETRVEGIFTDSRAFLAGGAFLAIRGERFDGHDYIEKVGEAGCRVFIVSRVESITFPEGSSVLLVKDTVEAYRKIAGAYRRQFKELVMVAVVGSNGKTTTKDLVAAVLAEAGPTLSSQRSFNNHIGVPQTLLEISSQHQYAVLEVGTNHPGELAPLLEAIKPRYGIVTSIGNEHLEFFKNREGVLAEEGTIAEALPEGGILFIPAETYGCAQVEGRLPAGCRCIKVSSQARKEATYCAELSQLGEQGTLFHVISKAKEVGEDQKGLSVRACQIRPLGAHQMTHALLAIALGVELGIPEEAIYTALSQCPPSEMRAEVRNIHGLRVLVDCYNANQDSMCAALEVLKSLQCAPGGKKVAILGTMGELGQSALEAHRQVANRAAALGVETVLFCGEYAAQMSAVFERGAQAGQRTKAFDTVELLLEQVGSFVSKGDCVLVKASRFQRFERVVQKLEECA